MRSLTPMNFIGLPVMDFSESAAPPRVSESNFVKMAPVIPILSSNALAISTAD